MTSFTLAQAVTQFDASVVTGQNVQRDITCNAALVLMRGGDRRKLIDGMELAEIKSVNKKIKMVENFAKVERASVEGMTTAKARDYLTGRYDEMRADAGTINAMYYRLTDDLTPNEVKGIAVVKKIADALGEMAAKYVTMAEMCPDGPAKQSLTDAAREENSMVATLTDGIAEVTIGNREQDNLAKLETLKARGLSAYSLAQARRDSVAVEPVEAEPVEAEPVEPVDVRAEAVAAIAKLAKLEDLEAVAALVAERIAAIHLEAVEDEGLADAA